MPLMLVELLYESVFRDLFLLLLQKCFSFSYLMSAARFDGTTIVISNERGQQSVLYLIQFFYKSCDGSGRLSREERESKVLAVIEDFN